MSTDEVEGKDNLGPGGESRDLLHTIGLDPRVLVCEPTAHMLKCTTCPEGRGGGVLHQIFSSWVQHAKQWTQSDLRFYENEGSKRFKITEKGVNWIENHGEN